MSAVDSGATLKNTLIPVTTSGTSASTAGAEPMEGTTPRIYLSSVLPILQQRSTFPSSEKTAVTKNDQPDDGTEHDDLSYEDDSDSEVEMAQAMQHDSSEFEDDIPFTVVKEQPGLYVFYAPKQDKNIPIIPEESQERGGEHNNEGDFQDNDQEDEDDEDWIECNNVDADLQSQNKTKASSEEIQTEHQYVKLSRWGILSFLFMFFIAGCYIPVCTSPIAQGKFKSDSGKHFERPRSNSCPNRAS